MPSARHRCNGDRFRPYPLARDRIKPPHVATTAERNRIARVVRSAQHDGEAEAMLLLSEKTPSRYAHFAGSQAIPSGPEPVFRRAISVRVARSMTATALSPVRAT